MQPFDRCATMWKVVPSRWTTFRSRRARNCDAVRSSPHVLSATIDGRTVLLDLQAGKYYGLDEVGSRIWEAIQHTASGAEIVHELALTYDVPADVLAADARRFVDDMKHRHLVVSL